MELRSHAGNHNWGIDISDCKTMSEAITKAGLDWRVMECDVMANIVMPEGATYFKQATRNKALVRSSDETILSVVGKDYKPVQNDLAFNFFDPIIQSGKATLDCAGSTKDGRMVYVAAKITGAEAEVLKGDPIKSFLLWSNSHGMNYALRGQFTSYRPSCTNAMTGWYSNHGKSHGRDYISVPHKGDMNKAIEAMGRVIDQSMQGFSMTIEAYKKMAKTKMSATAFKEYVREVLETPETELSMPRSYDVLERIYEVGPGQDIKGVKGMYYGGYNAITHWIDNYRGKNDAQKRLDSSLFGQGRVVRDRAFKIALEK